MPKVSIRARLALSNTALQKLLEKMSLTMQNLHFAAFLIALGFSLYFDLYASRPPQISEPLLVEPVGDKFIFDVDMLKDNELHRFAYITDEGQADKIFLAKPL